MATAKDFRRSIAECSKEAIEKHPANDYERLNWFVATLCGYLLASEPDVAEDLWRVLNPTLPFRNPDGA